MPLARSRLPALPALPAVIAAAVLLYGATGCTEVPELENSVTDDLSNSAYAALVPLGPALGAPRPAPAQAAEQLETTLNGRRDRLKARAGALQAGIIDEETRDRMRDGVTR